MIVRGVNGAVCVGVWVSFCVRARVCCTKFHDDDDGLDNVH